MVSESVFRLHLSIIMLALKRRKEQSFATTGNSGLGFMRILVGACAQTAPTFCATEFIIILVGLRACDCQQQTEEVSAVQQLTPNHTRTDRGGHQGRNNQRDGPGGQEAGGGHQGR